jgi:hypothetical protein
MNTDAHADFAEDAAGLEYLRRVYADVLGWYKVADNKGQLLLTVNGLFVSVLTGTVLGSASDAGERTQQFSPLTWVLAAVAGAAIMGSIAAAAMCLRSRLHNAHVDWLIRQAGVDPADPSSYKPATAWWFGTIARLDSEGMEQQLLRAGPQMEVSALASQVVLLSQNVLSKHQWANRGWLLAALALISLLSATASYLASAVP